MNYTETYNKVYSALSKTELTHVAKHNSSLRITDALNDVFSYTISNFPDIIEDIINVVNEFSSSVKTGGYDLDDK